MSQLDPTRYKRLTSPLAYAQSDGLYWDSTNSQLVMVMGDSVVARIDANGVSADLELSGEARGDLMRRGASAWEILTASNSGKVVMGDGTDVVSQAITGDMGLSGAGLATVTDLTITNEARGDIIRRGATAWERLVAKTSGQVLLGDGTDVISAALSGDIASVSAAGVVALKEGLIEYATATISAADIVDVAAGKLGHANGYPIVSAPAAGKALEFVSGVVILDYATDAYTAGGNLSFNYGGGGAVLSGVVGAANSLGAAADKVALVLATAPTNNQLSAATGINLVAAAAFTNPGTAAGVCRVKVAYRTHTTGL